MPSGTRKRIARAVRRLALGNLIGSQRTAGAIVFPAAAGLLRRLALGFDLRGRAVAVVGIAAANELRGHRTMAIEALRLKVRTVFAADLRPLVPVVIEEAQTTENPVDHRVGRALGVG